MSVIKKLAFEPDFVENAVFLTIRRSETNGSSECAGTWHTERSRIYLIKDSQARAKAFRQLDEEWFVRLGLRERFAAILSSFPVLKDPSLVIRIRRALSRKDEGSELYVQGEIKTNLVKVRTARLFEDDYLERFLRHEWLRLSDMLDPIFQYSPHVALSGSSEVEDDLIRDRYRILWDLYISIRLLKGQFKSLFPLDEQKGLIDKAFSKWAVQKREKIFWEILNQRYPTQSDFLELSRDERLAVPLGRGGLLCPLCHFTSFDPPHIIPEQEAAMIHEIQRDYPAWNVDLGICQNCCDLYRSKIRVAS